LKQIEKQQEEWVKQDMLQYLANPKADAHPE